MTGPVDPAGRTPEPSFGPDEEGELPLPEDGTTGDDAAWVHVDPQTSEPDTSDRSPRASD